MRALALQSVKDFFDAVAQVILSILVFEIFKAVDRYV